MRHKPDCSGSREREWTGGGDSEFRQTFRNLDANAGKEFGLELEDGVGQWEGFLFVMLDILQDV